MLAATSRTAPSIQSRPVTRNMQPAAMLPVQAQAAIIVRFDDVRSARAPTTGSTTAEQMVATVTT
jgi:hypothetical protein